MGAGRVTVYRKGAQARRRLQADGDVADLDALARRTRRDHDSVIVTLLM